MDISALLHLVVQVLIIGGIFYLIWWLIGYFSPPEPFAKILRGIVAVVAVVFLINLLLGLGGMTPIFKLK